MRKMRAMRTIKEIHIDLPYYSERYRVGENEESSTTKLRKEDGIITEIVKIRDEKENCSYQVITENGTILEIRDTVTGLKVIWRE